MKAVWLCLVLLLVLDFSRAQLRLPVISPSNDSIDIPPGSQLKIICVGDAPLQWHRQKIFTEMFTEPPSHMNEIETEHDRKYTLELISDEPKFSDTGPYRCSYRCESGDSSCEHYSSSIYVFVNDCKVLLVRELFLENLRQVIVNKDEKFWLPCKPTSSLMNDIALYKPDDLREEGELLMTANQNPAEFDPRYGFLLSLMNDTVIHCIPDGKHARRLTFIINVETLKIMLHLKDEVQLELGKSASLFCSSALAYNQYPIRWFKDGVELFDTERITLSKSSLQFNRVLEEDAGHYKCIVSDFRGSITATINVKVEKLGAIALSVSTLIVPLVVVGILIIIIVIVCLAVCRNAEIMVQR